MIILFLRALLGWQENKKSATNIGQLIFFQSLRGQQAITEVSPPQGSDLLPQSCPLQPHEWLEPVN